MSYSETEIDTGDSYTLGASISLMEDIATTTLSGILISLTPEQRDEMVVAIRNALEGLSFGLGVRVTITHTHESFIQVTED